MLPKLSQMKQKKITIDTFTGYCHKDTVPAGAFYDMKNMTCDDYPVLSTRGHRAFGDRIGSASPLAAGEEVYWIQDNCVVGTNVTLPPIQTNLYNVREIIEGEYYVKGVLTKQMQVDTTKLLRVNQGDKIDVSGMHFTSQFATTGGGVRIGLFWQDNWVRDLLPADTFEKDFFEIPKGVNQISVPFWADDKERYVYNLTQDEKKQEKRKLAIMGAYLCVFPDKVYINTKDSSLHRMERVFTCQKGYTMALFKVPEDFDFKNCSHHGAVDTLPVIIKVEIGQFYQLGDICIWIKNNPASLYQCTEVKQFDDDGKKLESPVPIWTEITNHALALAVFDEEGESVEIEGFEEGDHIELSGLSGEYESINGMHKVIRTKQRMHGTYVTSGGNYLNCSVLVIDGQVENDVYRYIESQHYETGPVDCKGLTLARTIPDMEYIISYQNRLWGCNSELNEVYCCALGSPSNWRNYEDVSTASYSASVGAPGIFTGACAYNGSIFFFKEEALFKIYGTRPANYTMTTIPCRGLERGSDKSLITINEHLYFKSVDGVCVYNNDVPVVISDSLGSEQYRNAVAGAYQNKYYIFLARADRAAEKKLFVYDTVKGLWSVEDDIPVQEFVSSKGELYFLADNRICSIGDVNERTVEENILEEEGTFDWFAETGDLYGTDLNHKFISKLQVSMEVNGTASVSFQQDTGRWEPVYRTVTTEKKVVSVPLLPKRCNTLRVRFEGTGDFKLYAMAMTIEEGSELYG